MNRNKVSLIQQKFEEKTDDERILNTLNQLLAFERQSKQANARAYKQDYKDCVDRNIRGR